MKWVKTFEKYSNDDKLIETCDDILAEVRDLGLGVIVKLTELMAYEIDSNWYDLTEESKKIIKININNFKNENKFDDDDVRSECLRVKEYLEGEGWSLYRIQSNDPKANRLTHKYGKYTLVDIEFYKPQDGIKYNNNVFNIFKNQIE